jgi:hypothetical protein
VNHQATTLIVIIASPEHLPALQARAAAAAAGREGHDVQEILTFADADALRALEAITKHKPAVVALERLFAATPRGAALINRVKADPSLRASEIRVVSHDSDYLRVSPRPAAPAPAPLDQRGTRRAPRVRISPRADATVDGHQASLVDLSTVGAQVVSPGMLKPNQRVQVVLADDSGLVRISADVVWASYEIPPKGRPRYRGGVAFIDADATAVDAYGLRHKA